MVRIVIAGVLLVVGAFLIAVAALGLIRLPDSYNRMNAVAKAATLGVVSVLMGVFALDPSPRSAVVLVAAAVLQLLTAPVAGFAVARAAYRSGAPLTGTTRYDNLAEARDTTAGGNNTPDA